MSQSQNVAYLNFSDEEKSFSFDSFCENGLQTIERPSSFDEMCICVELTDAGKLSVSWNGELHKELDLPGGSHKILLADNIPAGEGELALALAVGQESGVPRAYRLVTDYVMEYSEYLFRVHKDRRDAQTLKRLQMQCPAPQDGQTFTALSEEKYDTASREVEQVARLLGDLHALDLSHMFHITVSLGDTPDRRKQIDNRLSGLSGQLRRSLQILDQAALNVEHARYYAEQNV
jgi:hypothetical protein